MRACGSALMTLKRGVLSRKTTLKALMSFFSETVTTIVYACLTSSIDRSCDFFFSNSSNCLRLLSISCPLSWLSTCNQPWLSRMAFFAASNPSTEGTASTIALRYTRGASGPLFSFRKRLASLLGLPGRDAALGPKTT